MIGLYIHIPFCKKVCYYCDFHFTVSLKKKEQLIEAIIKEIDLRKDYAGTSHIDTIYFGGGTPSILNFREIGKILNQIHKNFTIDKNSEITIEVNPDDLETAYLFELKNLGFNRLSIGIQSFFDEELKWMNRRHNATQAEYSIKLSQDAGFQNINIDLIYGIPGLSNERWLQNLEVFFSHNIPHLSAYHLTIEPKTVFGYQKRKGYLTEVSEEASLSSYDILIKTTKAHNYEHYEVSNFCRNGYYSRHNTNYWMQGKYLGIGPSAHSFNGSSRQWNVSVNSKYIEAVNKGEIFYEIENLTESEQFNDYLLTGLRTIWGIDMEIIEKKFGKKYTEYLQNILVKYHETDYLNVSGNKIRLTEKGMFVSDSIISGLFLA
jgi:oxygen-independent coproporphyrinogen III oxidase